MHLGRTPEYINLFSCDGGKTFDGVGCGPRKAADWILEHARAAAGLGPDQRTVVMGWAVTGITLVPPLKADVAQVFATAVGSGLGVEQVTMLDVEPMGRRPAESLGNIMLI